MRTRRPASPEHIPLTDPMSSGNPNAASSPRGYDAPRKNSRKKWYWICGILLAIIVIGAVLGGVLGTQLNKDDDDKSSKSGSSGSSSDSNTGVPSGVSNVNTATKTAANGDTYLAIATDSEYMLPVYATGTATAGYSAPTTSASDDGKWPDDPDSVSNSSIRSHPRIGAPAYKWDALKSELIANNPYFSFWNDTIVANATDVLNKDPLSYVTDGGLDGSGVLDIAREMKVRVKNLAYAYRITNNTEFAERAWSELETAAGNNTAISFGADDGTRWNPAHFLDLAEFTAMFAIGYDWLYDYWSEERRAGLRSAILNYGLHYGQLALSGDSQGSTYNWWASSDTKGNWNCVCNGGLILGALAIIDEDTSGVASNILELAVPSARDACFQAAHSDGTWAETANYWYFGTTGAAEMASALITSYGDDRGLTSVNSGWNLTSMFHIYAQGMTSLFNYGDHGPNKFSSTANSLLLWANIYNEPRYALYQRDHYDAPEPWSMFWYNPETKGTWWDGLPIDRHFDSTEGNWATARTGWADNDGSYWAMKSGLLTGHQTHGDLDLGDFVYDAQGQRWFGELGSGQYLSPGYFSDEAQNSERWLYYRKRTEGQNTILINYENQNVNATPSQNWGSTGTAQGAAPSFDLEDDDTAFFTQDLTSAYNYTVKRGIRFLNGRKQVLIQDDFSGLPNGANVQWRAHTNASVSVNDATATLTLGGETLIASIVQGPSGAAFSTAQPTPASQDPPQPTATTSNQKDEPDNDGVTVLVVETTADGTDYSLQISLEPQWSGFSAVTPANVAIDSWSLTSHN